MRALARLAQERIGEMTSAVERSISAAGPSGQPRRGPRDGDRRRSAREAYAAGCGWPGCRRWSARSARSPCRARSCWCSASAGHGSPPGDLRR
ncbi:hypothetical protein NKG94_07625 [Micromonospora sp. M12]